MPQFCLVKHSINTYVIDGTDPDRNPDMLPVNGRVIFEPLLEKGDSAVVTENGSTTTVALNPIEARITGSELYHRGEPGIKLFAGGATSNPERIRYRARFENLVSGTNSVTLKNIVFEAVPGGEVELSLTQPVPRQPYPGIGADQALVNSANEAADRAWEAFGSVHTAEGVMEARDAAVDAAAEAIAASMASGRRRVDMENPTQEEIDSTLDALPDGSTVMNLSTGEVWGQ